MANRTWKSAADGIWTVGSNWSDGTAPAAGDSASFTASGSYTATLPKGTYSLGSLTVVARYATLSLSGSTLAAGSITLTAGTLRNGVLSSQAMTAGASTGGLAVLDAMTIAGTMKVGGTTGDVLTIQNGLTMAAGAVLEFAGSTGQLAVDNTQAVTGGTILVDAGNTTKIQPGTGVGALALNGTNLEVKGTLTANGITMNGSAHVVSGGLLYFGASSAATTTFGPNARIVVDAGGKVQTTQAMTSDTLADFASKVSRSSGAAVVASGDIDNTGRTLDLSSGSTVASNVTVTGDRVTGGTITNGGAAASLNLGALYGVTLRGLFRADSADITTLNVRDSLAVLNSDGSAGTLNLANAGTALVVESVGGATTGTFTLANMTLLASSINVAVATVLDASFTATVTAFGGIHGTVVNRGTVAAAQGAYLDLGGGSGLNGSGSAGRFQNDGTVTVAANANLAAAAGFVNNGVVRLADSAVATFDGSSVGTLSIEGKNVHLGFNAKGATGALVGLNSDDQLFFKAGSALSGAAMISGRTLTVTGDGAVVATFDLGQDGWSTSDFTTSVTGGSIVVSNTHGAATTPVTTTPPVMTTPTGPTTPTTPADDGVSPITVVAGATLTTGTAGRTVTVASTGTIVSNGPDRITGGSGATTVQTNGVGALITGGTGALSVAGGSGSNTTYAGAGGLTYQGGSGFDTVVGFGQRMMAMGGTGGGMFFGGGNATITAGAGGDLNVIIGGNGDRLYASGPKGVLFGTSGGDVLMSSAADTGTSVFFGTGGTGRMTFITGAGIDLLALGQNTNDVTLGSGHAIIFANGGTTSHTTINAGSGSLDLAFSGADTLLSIAASSARTFNLYGLENGSNHIHLQGYGASQAADAIAGQRNFGGGTQLSLSDGSVISLVGVERATANLFT